MEALYIGLNLTNASAVSVTQSAVALPTMQPAAAVEKAAEAPETIQRTRAAWEQLAQANTVRPGNALVSARKKKTRQAKAKAKHDSERAYYKKHGHPNLGMAVAARSPRVPDAIANPAVDTARFMQQASAR